MSSERRQSKNPKAALAAYKALLGILTTKELRLGQYREVLKVRLAEVRRYDSVTKTVVSKKNVLTELESEAVCCLSDIPIAHLSYHAGRYGKFAIGFHRDSVIAHGFNPVFYTLHDARIIQSIYKGFGELQYLDATAVRDAASNIESDSDEALSSVSELEMAADDIESAVDEARSSIQQFLAFVKTFDSDEFGTIYCEREWRATRPLNFDYSNVAMVVVPRRVGAEHYFDEFIAKEVGRLKLPRSIPIIPWEDLIEY